MAKNGREAALAALMKYRKSSMFSEQIVEQMVKDGIEDERETALFTKLFYGVLQNMTFLDYYIDLYSSTQTTKMENKVLDILRISAYQIIFMDRIPASAAVNEAVKICKKSAPKAAGLVNAVLRRISENSAILPEIKAETKAKFLAIKYSQPEWFADMIISEHGYDFCEEFFRENNEEPPIYAQVNTLKITKADLVSLFSAKDIEAKDGNGENSLILENVGNITKLKEFREGLFYVQDEAAKTAIDIIGIKPDMKVLDSCAAPGGKSFSAAMQMENRGEIVSCDLKENKLSKITDTALRLGIDIIKTRVQDGRILSEDLIDFADVAIVDVPCSGLGVIRKKPEIRYKSYEEIAKLPEIQYDILIGQSKAVKAGGILMYSTCTVLKQENEEVVEKFLENNRGFSLVLMKTFYPHIDKTDGFFVCKMVKSILRASCQTRLKL